MAKLKPQYTFDAERAGNWWAIDVSEHPGVFTQAKRLDHVETMARHAIALFLEVSADSFGIAIREVFSAQAELMVVENTHPTRPPLEHE